MFAQLLLSAVRRGQGSDGAGTTPDGRADVPTDETSTGTPLPDQDARS
ncbi:hypothetical protein [Actinoalloteichus sp. AHMU CJ021]